MYSRVERKHQKKFFYKIFTTARNENVLFINTISCAKFQLPSVLRGHTNVKVMSISSILFSFYYRLNYVGFSQVYSILQKNKL